MELKDFIKMSQKRDDYLDSYKRDLSKDSKLKTGLTVQNYNNFLNFVSENQMPSSFGGFKVRKDLEISKDILEKQLFPENLNSEKLELLREALLELNVPAPLTQDNYPFFERDGMSTKDRISILSSFYKSLDNYGIFEYTNTMLSTDRLFCEKYSLLYKLYKRSKGLSSLVCLDYCDKSSYISIEKGDSLYFLTQLQHQAALALLNRHYPELEKIINTSNVRILGKYLEFILIDYLEENKLYLKDTQNKRIININRIIERVNGLIKYMSDNGIDMSISFEKQMDKFRLLDNKKIDLVLSSIIEYAMYENTKEKGVNYTDILLNGYNDIYLTGDKINALNLTDYEVISAAQKIKQRIKRR